MRVHHRYATIEGRRLFYREAGPAGAPAVILLHGYPTSSFMFRDLIPRLADRYHVIAPDYLGFGQSDAPTVDEFDYSFDALARLTAGLLGHLGVDRYAIYVQDYGAPIGWRLALQPTAPVTAIISQNGNGYEAGFVPEFWAPIWAYGDDPNAQNEAALRPALSLDAIVWQYTHGVPDPSVVAPDTWTLDHALLQRPGNDAVQLRLFGDYHTNRELYPRLQEYLRDSQIPSSRSGVATTRSSPRRVRRHSGTTCPTRRFTCWTAGTFCWRAKGGQWRNSSTTSSAERS